LIPPLKITIPGVPVPKNRPRATIIAKWKLILAGYAKTVPALRKLIRAHIYSDQEDIVNATKLIIKSQLRGIKPYEGAVAVRIAFYMPITKSTTKKDRAAMLSGKKQHVKMPDVDNLEKFLFDCMNNIVWSDDSQVVAPFLIKRYDENPRTEIEILPMYAATPEFWAEHHRNVFGGQGSLL